jgi:hypothetical protein
VKAIRLALGAEEAGALLLTGCGSEATDDSVDENPSGEKIVAEVNFPLPHTDLRASAAPGMGDADLRRLAAALADLDGVAVTEADYGARSIGLVLEAALDDGARAGVARRAAGLPGVAAVAAPG